MSKKSTFKPLTVCLLTFCFAAALALPAAAAPQTYSETIKPNKLTIAWQGSGRPETVLDAFRIRGYNVAQLRAMVAACGGTVTAETDGTYRIVKSAGQQEKYDPISFAGAASVKVQYNATSIRDTDGDLVTPSQPGWVYLPDYRYNWGSLRDILDAMGLSIQSVADDPANQKTRVVVSELYLTYDGSIAWEKNHLGAVIPLEYAAKPPDDLWARERERYGIPIDHVLLADGDEVYVILPRYAVNHLIVEKLEYNEFFQIKSAVTILDSSGPVILACNPSDLFSNVRVTIQSGGKEVVFSPKISLKDGSLVLPPSVLGVMP